MTTEALPAHPVIGRPAILRVLRSEWIKLTSTNTWWIIGLTIVASTAAALAYNIFVAGADLGSSLTSTNSPQDATDVMTSGQFAGALLVMLLATLTITNEYYHQTATATFLATPRRGIVIAGKFTMALLIAAGVWAASTVVDAASASLFYRSRHAAPLLFSHLVGRAILVNLMVYLLWAAFGIGIGALIRSQLGTTVTALMIYTIGTYAIEAVAYLVYQAIWHNRAVYVALILIPGFAAQVASGPRRTTFEGVTYQWWEGVIVMAAYGILATVIGTWILRRRDIS